MLNLGKSLEKTTGDYHASKGVLPVQRFFHKSRLKKMHVMDLETYRNVLLNKVVDDNLG
jgi:hypothetical protein